MITVDMPKARDIWRNKIRAQRDEKLKQLDVDYMRAVENDDTEEQATIATKKQQMRDAPADPRIDSATTPEQLKAVVPAGLED